MASSSASEALSRPPATPEMLFRPELAKANPRFITVARWVMSVCEVPEPTTAARWEMSVSESLPTAVASPAPTDPPEPETPVPVTALRPLLAWARPSHKLIASWLAKSSISWVAAVRAAWVTYWSVSLPIAVASPVPIAPGLPDPPGVEKMSLTPEFASAAPMLMMRAICRMLATA